MIFPHKSEYKWTPEVGSDQHYVFFFPREVRLFLSRYIDLPDEYTLQAVSDSPDGAYSYQDEGNVFNELSLIRLYDQNGDIKMSKRDRPLASTF